MLHTNCEWSKFSEGYTWWRPLANAWRSSMVSVRLERFVTGSSFGLLEPFVLLCSRNRCNFDECLSVTLVFDFCAIWLMIDRSRVCTMQETQFFNAALNRAWWRMSRRMQNAIVDAEHVNEFPSKTSVSYPSSNGIQNNTNKPGQESEEKTTTTYEEAIRSVGDRSGNPRCTLFHGFRQTGTKEILVACIVR